MADHGQLINARRYWTYTGPDGKPAVSDTAPGGGVTGSFLGLGDKPNTPATEYEERTYEDGTQILSRFDTAKDTWVQESVTVDTGLRQQHNDQRAGQQPKPSPTRTLPDGTMQEMQPDGSWIVLGTKPQGPPAPDTEAPTVRTRPDGSQEAWNPTTRQWEPHAAAEPKPGDTPKIPELDVGGARPGQRTDLRGVKAGHDAFVAGLNANKALTPEERARQYQTYMATVVQPQIDRATDEANAEADRQVKRQEQQDAMAARNAELAEAREGRAQTAADRQATTDAARLGLERDRFGLEQETAAHRRGQDAVENSLALLKYKVDPSFSPSLAGIYNNILGGSGQSFQPGAFQFDLPDLDAVAAAHVAPILAMHSNAMQPPGGTAAAPGAMPVAAQTAAPVDPLAGIPVAPRVPPVDPNRDRWYAR